MTTETAVDVLEHDFTNTPDEQLSDIFDILLGRHSAAIDASNPVDQQACHVALMCVTKEFARRTDRWIASRPPVTRR